MSVPPWHKRVAQEFVPLLARFDTDRLELDPNVTYGLTADRRIGYLNPAWFRVADQNQASAHLARWGLGCEVLEAFGPLRNRYEMLFAKAQKSGQPQEQLYGCRNSLQRRDFMMRILPLEQGALLIHNTLVECRPEHDPGFVLSREYEGPGGYIVACSNCRRVKNPKALERWDWVPAILGDTQLSVTHALCEPCLGFYYPLL
jgi:hypothetical protein